MKHRLVYVAVQGSGSVVWVSFRPDILDMMASLSSCRQSIRANRMLMLGL